MPHLLPTQYTDDLGAALPNGSVEFYLGGTATPSNLAYPSFTDAINGTNKLGTSVGLDSTGRPGAAQQIWFTDISMKYIVKNSLGVPIGPTIDNLSGSGSGQVTVIDSGNAIEINILKDNDAAALVFQEGANAYQTFSTLDGNESINISKSMFFPNDVQLRFGNTNADPNAFIEFDTALTPDALLIKVDNSLLNIQLQTSSGDIIMAPGGSPVMTHSYNTAGSFVPTNIPLRFGNTNADPDAYIEFDTSTTPDQLIIRVDNLGFDMHLYVASGDIILSPSNTKLLTASATSLTSTGTYIGPASTTNRSSLRLPHGDAPSVPTDGDVWTTTAGMYVRINGGTVGPLAA